MKDKHVYFYASLVAIGLIIFNQVFIQYWLFQKQADANLINSGGRQRMLSQKVLAQSLSLKYNYSAKTEVDLKQSFSLWKENHAVLKKTFQEINDGESLKRFQELRALDPYFVKAQTSIEYLAQLDDHELKDYQESQESFQSSMKRNCK